MDISLVKDLILTRKDGYISNLKFYLGTSVLSIYPDYDIAELNSQNMQDLFLSCNLFNLELDKSAVNVMKVTQLVLHMKSVYSVICDDYATPNKYQLVGYKLAK